MFVESGLLREKLPEIALLSGVASYVVAILFLTVLGSPVFFYGCYVGTFLFMATLIGKMGMFTCFTWRRVLFVLLMFSSAMLFTTALVSIFTQVGIAIHGFYDAKNIQYGTTYWNRAPGGSTTGTYQPNGCFETRPLYSFAGYTLEILRPWVWLFLPSVIGGALLFLTGLIMVYRSE